MSKSTSMVSWMGNLWARTLRSTSRRRNARSVEALESRVLLATLVSANKLTYQDADGDNVEVAFSKPILNAGNVNAIFTFDTGTVNGSNATKQQLRTINLTGVAGAAGTTIITKAVRSATTGGDGFAAIGQIDATGIDISTVTIDGDLGRIIAGDATTTTQGLGALTVHSLGRFGTFTGATNLNSSVTGNLLSLKAKTDVKEARLEVVSGLIGTVTIGGSLIGGNATESGLIFANGIGPVSILGNVTGGAGQLSGGVFSNRALTSVTIGGSLTGSSGLSSGLIFSFFDMGAVKVTGNVQGGSQESSGRIQSRGDLASVTIGGSLIGGTGTVSGQIFSEENMGAVKITGNVQGGTQARSGSVQALGSLASATIGGSLIGGGSDFTGAVTSDRSIGPLVVTGSIIGGTGIGSGYVFGDFGIASLTIGGSLIGGSGQSTGHIASARTIGPVVISGDVRGGSFDSATPTGATGAILTNGSITSVTIGGSLIGGEGDHSGLLVSGLLGLPAGIGAVKIGRDLRGGSGISSGRIQSAAALASVTIGGSLVGSTGNRSGSVSATGELTTVTITGNIQGGSIGGSASLQDAGIVQAGRIGTMTLGGSLIAGTGTTSGLFINNGAIRSENDIASLTIKGSVTGRAVDPGVMITARGRQTPTGTTDLAIGKLTINGRVEGAQILAGYQSGTFAIPQNADAQIGPVVIGGDWIASNLVAGALDNGGNGFGNSGDAKISGGGVKDVPTVFSKITSIVIGGEVLGTVVGTDHFGFVAENIGSFKVKGGTTTFPMLAGVGNDTFLVGLLGDVRVFELD